jgi:transcriptional regulator with XRE-family HTH domain
MKITISQSLRRLRRERGNTQTDLAAHLGISMQAVSKWETGDGYPDIELLPAIASYYNVSIDELLGVDEAKRSEKIAEYLQRDIELNHLGRVEESLALCRAAYAEFPNEPVIMGVLMKAIFNVTLKTGEWQSSCKDEIITFGEKIIDSATVRERGALDTAIQLCCYACSFTDDLEGAKRYAEMAPDYSITRNALYPNALSGKEMRAAYQSNVKRLTQMLANEIGTLAGNGMYDPAFAISAHEAQLRLYELVFPNGDYGCYHKLLQAYKDLAVNHARLGDCEAAVECLAKAAGYAVAYDTRETSPHTSPFVDMLVDDITDSAKNNVGNQSLWLLNDMLDDVYDWEKGLFDPIRADPRFTKIVVRLRESAE